MTSRSHWWSNRSSYILVAILLVLLSSPDGCYAKQRRPQQHRSPTNRDNMKQDSDNYYSVLDMPKTASAKKIKSAYRKLALKYHPDKVEEKEKQTAEEKFVRINEAYSVLGDEKKRNIYDNYGKNGLDAHEKGQDPNTAGFGGFDGFGGSGSSSGSFNFDFGAFEKMFGQGSSGFRGHHQQQQPKREPELFVKGESNVARLGKPKFPNENSKNMWLIMFFHNDEAKSRNAAQTLERLAEKSHSPYKVGAVDCSASEQQAQFCESQGVAKYPQFVMVQDGGMETLPVKSSVSAKKLHEKCMNHMPHQLIQNVNNLPQLDERLLGRSIKPAALLLTDKYETSSMYYSLVYQFRKDFTFGESRAKNLNLAKFFGVKKYPELVVFVPANVAQEEYNDEYGIIRYPGVLKKEAIVEWLVSLQQLVDNVSKSSETNKSRRSQRRR